MWVSLPRSGRARPRESAGQKPAAPSSAPLPRRLDLRTPDPGSESEVVFLDPQEISPVTWWVDGGLHRADFTPWGSESSIPTTRNLSSSRIVAMFMQDSQPMGPILGSRHRWSRFANFPSAPTKSLLLPTWVHGDQGGTQPLPTANAPSSIYPTRDTDNEYPSN